MGNLEPFQMKNIEAFPCVAQSKVEKESLRVSMVAFMEQPFPNDLRLVD